MTEGSDPAHEIAAPRRALLAHAIDDLQGSIHANDSKASAALVVHGLLFAGVLTITREIGPVYREAGAAGQDVIVILLVAALIAFMSSVVFLLRAIAPYHPKELASRIRDGHRRIFFPDLPELASAPRHELAAMVERLETVTTLQDVEAEYAAELVKLAEILRHESVCARWGYWLLTVEVVAVGCYLGLVGALALG